MYTYNNYKKQLKTCKMLDLFYYVLFILAFTLSLFLPCFKISYGEKELTFSIFNDLLSSLSTFNFLNIFYYIAVITTVILTSIGLYKFIKKIKTVDLYEKETYNFMKRNAETELTELLKTDHDSKTPLISTATYIFICLIGFYSMIHIDNFSKIIYVIFTAIAILILFACFIGIYKSKLTKHIGKDLYMEQIENDTEVTTNDL